MGRLTDRPTDRQTAINKQINLCTHKYLDKQIAREIKNC